MATRYQLSTCLLSLLILSACAVDRQSPTSSAKERDPSFWCAPKLPTGKGRIWIYRTAPKGTGLPPEIVVNNKLYEALIPGTAYTIDVAPGEHEVKLAHDKDKLEIEVPRAAIRSFALTLILHYSGEASFRSSSSVKPLNLKSANTQGRTSIASKTNRSLNRPHTGYVAVLLELA